MVEQALEQSSINITLPDGNIKEFTNGVTGLDIAKSIGEGLAKAAIAIRVNDELYDLTREIESDSKISIITGRDEDGLEIIRHDTAHIMAEAVQELYPETQVTIGPSIENGFYYDFAREKPFSTDDLEKIEAKMAEIVKRDEPIIRKVMDRDEAVEFFKAKGEKYKVELIEAIPPGEDVTFYQQGDFIDLCRGPHAPSTGKQKAFKLMKVAGAYWRGDSNNEMLHRIYGTAWSTEKELKQYLHRLEEAERRDHRKLGREMELFHIQEEAQGQVFWHDNGWTLYRELENYIRRKIQKADYTEVKTPMLVDRTLWEKSGHWDKFRENMFISESEDKPLAIKPMNCPCHVQIFNQGLKSYRDLPLRMAEFGSCHRNEPSGALHGLMRVRAMVQDDAHIFCTEEQIVSETELFCDLLKEVYQELGFDEIAVKIATRPDVRAGTDETWEKAEKSLIDAVEHVGLKYEIAPGEGAFYGPKLEFHLKDTIGRSWQCGTLQMDFVLPERLDANYIGADGNKHRPVMLHRAILGSLERFIGILIEQYAGKFPLWLAPVQAVVVTVTSDADEYAKEVHKALKDSGVRAKIDISNEQISYKIRQYSTQKTPIIIAVGKREVEQRTASIRRIGSKKQETLDFKELIDNISSEAKPPA
jgi:threonyl-tRNA synthetase